MKCKMAMLCTLGLMSDLKTKLKVDLITLLAKHDYPLIAKDEVFKEIFEF